MSLNRSLREKAKNMKLKLAGYQKTRNGVVKKVATPGAMPSNPNSLGTEVKQSNE